MKILLLIVLSLFLSYAIWNFITDFISYLRDKIEDNKIEKLNKYLKDWDFLYKEVEG